MNIYFFVAALLSIINLLLHFFAGGKDIARPLLEANCIPDEVKYVQYFCWHITTLSLLFLAASFGYSALYPDSLAIVIATTALSGGIAILGISMPLRVGLSYKQMPQGWLFLPVTIVPIFGIFSQ